MLMAVCSFVSRSSWRVLGLAMLAAAAQAQTAPEPILMRGQDGVQVTRSDVLSDARRIPNASRQVFLSKPENVQRLAEGLYVRRALAQEAESLKLDNDPLIQAELRQARDRVLSEVYLRHLDEQNPPSEQALQRFALTRYQADTSKFQVPAQSRARHILLSKEGPDAREKAESLLKSLREGASFEDLAKQHSIDYASAQKGGDLGYFGKGRMVKPFEEAVDALKAPGELSGIVESQFGLHMIRLEDRRDAKTLSFEEVKEQLMTEALTALRREKRDLAVAQARNAAQTDENALKAVVDAFQQELKKEVK